MDTLAPDAPASVQPPADAFGLTSLGRVVGVTADGGTADLVCETAGGRATVRIEALSDHVLRIRLAAPGSDFEAHRSYALDPAAEWAGPRAWELTESPNRVALDTGALHIETAREACRLRITDRAGAVLLDEWSGAAWIQGEGGGRVAHSTTLEPGDRLFGLGDKAFGLDRRGRHVATWCTDAFMFQRGTDPIYKSVPFVLKTSEGPEAAAVGLFYDNTHRAVFDLGAATPERMRYEADGGALDLYVIAGAAPLDIVRRFARLTGRQAMLPRWALGYHQCRYSYRDEGDISAIARELRERRIPCDALYFDIHYMDGYRVFTWDREAFPDPEGLLRRFQDNGFHAVVIIDPGVKADDPDYGVYQDGAARDAYLRRPDGEVVLGRVWPGICAFPDYTDPDVREWWGSLHAGLLEQGVDGVWNDMNEPAVFEAEHTDGSMVAEASAGTLPVDVRHALDGRGGSHAEAHNVYGMQMARATAEGLRRLAPDKRPFVITRASYAGAQRFCTSWTGDNTATWDHLRLGVQMMLSLGISGQGHTGTDVGGFTGTPTGELLARWTQLGALSPLFRNHSAIDTPRQEPWLFGDDIEAVCREAIELRMRLLPHLYTALWQSATDGTPMLRALPLVHPDDETIRRTGPLGFYVGDGLLAQPVVVEGQTEREIYLPESAGGWYDVATGAHHEGRATVWTETPLDRIPLYAKAGQVLALGPVRQHVGEPVDALELRVYAARGRHESRLYEDGGDGWAHEDGEHWTGTLVLDDDGDTLTLTTEVEGRHVPEWAHWDVVLVGLDAEPRVVEVDGVSVAASWEDQTLRFRVAAGAAVRIVR